MVVQCYVNYIFIAVTKFIRGQSKRKKDLFQLIVSKGFNQLVLCFWGVMRLSVVVREDCSSCIDQKQKEMRGKARGWGNIYLFVACPSGLIPSD